MAINRYSNAQTYQGNLYAPPIDLVASAMEHLQQRYDKNFMIAQEIKNNFVPSLPQDRAMANELQKQYETRIDETIQGYGGDYSRATQDLQKVLYDIKKDYGPGGKAGAIISNYNTYNEWRKNSQELVEKGKVLGQDLNLADQYYMNSYQGIGELDPVAGTYNRLNPETLTDYVNPDELIQNVYKNFKPQKYKVGRTEFRDGKQIYTEQEVEGIAADRLEPSFNEALRSDPKFFNYIRQKMKFEGTDPNDVEEAWTNYTRQRAQDLSYMNTSDIQKAERDPLFLLREKSRLKKAEDQELMQLMSAQYQYEPSVEAVAREKSNLSESNWRMSGAPVNTSSSGSVFGAQVYDPMARTQPSDVESKTLRDALKEKSFVERSKVNPHLMEAVMQEQASSLASDPNKAQEIFNRKYGKDKAWTDAFDKQVVKDYKKQESQHSRFSSKSIRIESPEAREQISLELAGQLGDPSRVSVYKVGSNAIQSAKDAGLDASAFITKDNKLRKDIDVGYVLPGPGYAAAGYRVSTENGTFVVVDQNVSRRELSRELEGGLNPIFFQNQKTGNPVRIGSKKVGQQDQDIYAQPELMYVPNGSGGFTEELRFNVLGADKEGRLKPTGQTVGGRDIDLYDRYIPQFEGALGAGAAKKDYSLFSFLRNRVDAD